jgi:hypothetical protein
MRVFLQIFFLHISITYHDWKNCKPSVKFSGRNIGQKGKGKAMWYCEWGRETRIRFERIGKNTSLAGWRSPWSLLSALDSTTTILVMRKTVLDDILGCSKLEFLGNIAKLYYNNRNVSDSIGTTRCTRCRSVGILKTVTQDSTRKLCFARLATWTARTPIPKKMRALLGDIVKQGKLLQPDCFIRTKVNVEKLNCWGACKKGIRLAPILVSSARYQRPFLTLT